MQPLRGNHRAWAVSEKAGFRQILRNHGCHDADALAYRPTPMPPSQRKRLHIPDALWRRDWQPHDAPVCVVASNETPSANGEAGADT